MKYYHRNYFFLPVSYTHLDVYKRQMRMTPCTTVARPILVTLLGWCSVNSVSYTHLDVYKRQAYNSPVSRCNFEYIYTGRTSFRQKLKFIIVFSSEVRFTDYFSIIRNWFDLNVNIGMENHTWLPYSKIYI